MIRSIENPLVTLFLYIDVYSIAAFICIYIYSYVTFKHL